MAFQNKNTAIHLYELLIKILSHTITFWYTEYHFVRSSLGLRLSIKKSVSVHRVAKIVASQGGGGKNKKRSL